MISALLTIALLHWIALVTPGPNILVVTNLAAGGSRRAAVCAAMGVTVVAGIWSVLAVLGVSAVFTAHHYLRMAVQAVGGCYLIYMGLQFWRTGPSNADVTPIRPSPLVAFRMGFLANITNPKAVLFFSSVFVTGLPAAPSALLLASAVILVIANALVWYLTIAVAFSHPRVQASYAHSRKAIGRACGIVVGAFGVRLLISSLHS